MRLKQATREHLGEFELIVLLALVRLGENAYGVPVRREIEKRTKRQVTVGALYRTLDRLEAKGYVSSWFSDPVPERGGRSKRYFRMEPLGIRALQQSARELNAMWDGVDLEKVRHAS
jgi:PadR family transcriptional regulator, regulatory protein PadR